MSQRACSVFGSLLLATLIAAPAAHAVCKSPKNICKHIDDCLQRTSDNTDAQRIREGVRARNGNMVGAGAEACARDLGKKKNGTTGPVGAQILSTSQLLGRKWNSEKAIATGTHNKLDDRWFHGSSPDEEVVSLRPHY
jgi:hypothetical protein